MQRYAADDATVTLCLRRALPPMISLDITPLAIDTRLRLLRCCRMLAGC